MNLSSYLLNHQMDAEKRRVQEQEYFEKLQALIEREKQIIERERNLKLKEEEFEREKAQFYGKITHSKDSESTKSLGKMEEKEAKDSSSTEKPIVLSHPHPYLLAKDGTRVIHDDQWLEPYKEVLKSR